MKKFFPRTWVICISAVFCAVLFGSGMGILLANTFNVMHTEHFSEFIQALPTRLLDINGELITEFASDEKREIVELNQLPQHMLDALLAREDKIFYQHRGFSVKGLMRAVIGVLTRKSLGGGSTLTQQIAGILYADRSDRSVIRKLRELWWAIQMERRYTKNEILELYLNKAYLGGGTYGVNAASKFYFGHGVQEITPAEAAILVIQLSNPELYNPFENPNRAMSRQQEVLRQMVVAGYISSESAAASFDDYWVNFDYTRTKTGAFFMRDDKAPWFSEYVLRELVSMIYGNLDVYTGGFTVHTTLNLKHQTAAQELMTKQIEYANRVYRNSTNVRKDAAFSTYIPLVEMLSLTFDLPAIKVSQARVEIEALSAYNKQINPLLDALSLMCGIESLKVGLVNRTNAKILEDSSKTTVEGTLITLENETGHITALVGGSKFAQDNQFIRAVQARVQPGSTFKPLYYSAAIDSQKFTAASTMSDTPIVFYTEDGKPYIPENFKGEWVGQVQFWYALAKSMNVPSLKVLDGIGFDAAIERAVALLGIPKNEVPSRGFDRVYPLALGVCSTRPIEIARAYAVFANQGKAVDPIAIRSVQDRNGKTILDPERELRIDQRSRGKEIQVISPQTAFIMTDILKNSVQMGTLASSTGWGTKFQYRAENGKKYEMPAAGKTGTTQNWSDVWAVGYTPYLTTAIWFGFDKKGQSLGLELTGATLAGPVWGDYMRIIHEELPMKEFVMPQTGLIKANVCSVSGHILTPACGTNITTQYFLEGTQPTTVCDFHINRESAQNLAVIRLSTERYKVGESPAVTNGAKPLTLDLSFLDGGHNFEEQKQTPQTPLPQGTTNSAPTHNYLLD